MIVCLAFTLQIASLDDSCDLALLQSLEDFRSSMFRKNVMVALKGVMKELHSCLNEKDRDDISLYCTVMSELLFIPQTSFMHFCYLSHVKAQPVTIKSIVMKCWVGRVQQLAQIEPLMVVEIMHSITAMGIFLDIQVDICMMVLDVIGDVLKNAMESDVYIGEEAEAMLEKVSTMGYSILSKCPDDISTCACQKLETCCLLVVRLLKVCQLLFCSLVCFHTDVNI